MRRLDGKVAIITASGTGMGRASARLMAKEGAKVVVADINPVTGQETVKLIKDAGGQAIFIRVDVAHISDLERMVKTAVDTYGKLNVLFNHAGTPGPAGIDSVDVAQWDREVAVNLRSGFFASKFAIPEIKKAGGGSIIFTSSTSGLVGSPASPVYSATKGGVVLLGKALALALAKDNIRVNVICPANIRSPMLNDFFNRPGQQGDPEEMRKAFTANIPMGRVAEPEEVGWVAVFLASDESSWITGVALPVDGGFTAK